ncbi:hypothetical protein CYLTODRAFT_420764 [Cylindrobasidium torrendii FP15055 ss-10]|uniref:Tubulin-specific chaperone A n=1 Tax=Cylindrobasidium torrendii FP15055 ss-10 TaxID=1314674 RepID=A0A0D7BFP1_9AGAR|nr:hypothetical protein CYLTODRAFT_420764 [Cylindrobasidium torrendii FP15055 ss-10]
MKEHTLYRKEAEDNKVKLDKMIASGIAEDEWEVKNAKRVLDESNRMIEDSATRAGRAAGELRDLVVSVKTKPEFQENPELLNAETVLEEVTI